MRQPGTIRRMEGRAYVQMDCASACSGCRGCSGQKPLRVDTPLPDGARVLVEMPEGRLARASLWAWGLPLVLLVAGVAAGVAAERAWLSAALGIGLPLLGILALRPLEPFFEKRYAVALSPLTQDTDATAERDDAPL